MAMGEVIARLAVSLDLQTAAFEKGAQQASGAVGKLKNTMTKVGGALAGALALDTIVGGLQQLRAATRDAIDAVGGLGEAASQIGVDTSSLQEFRYIATQVGLSAQEMDAGLSQLTKRLGEAAQGSKAPTEALERLGISLDQVKGKSATEVTLMIADGMAKIVDPAERAAIAVDLYSKAGQKMLPALEGGAAGIQAMVDAAREMGLVLTPEEIANADKYGDAMAALDAKVNAQLAAKLSQNAEGLYKYEKAVADTKLALVDFVSAFGDFDGWYRETSKRNADSTRAFISAITTGFTAFTDGANRLAREVGQSLTRALGFVTQFAQMGRNLVQGLANGIRAGAGQVWQALSGVVTNGISRAKALLGIQSPSRVFMEIGDYIGQGLAIGIEGGKGRVDAATKKLTDAARRAAEETQALFARLFPELEAANNYRRDLARIAGSGRSDEAQTQARLRLTREYTGTGGEIPISVMNDNTALDVTKGMEDVLAKLDTFGKKAGAVTVNVAKSFKDMADATIQSLQNLAGSIKGGGFLDILSAVVGLGMQLGSIGAFGKTIAGRINAPKIPGYANGTNFHPGGLAVVGERGPELVNLRRGAQVIPNNALGGGKLHVSVAVENGNLRAFVRDESGQMIAQSAGPIIDAGGRAGVAKMGYQQRRRVA